MAGRAARNCVGLLAALLAAGGPVGAADPVAPPVADPPIVAPPLPPTAAPPDAPAEPPPAPARVSVPPGPATVVTAFQRPTDPPLPNEPQPPGRPPALEPFLPQPPAVPEVVLPDGTRVNLPPSVRQSVRFSPRYGQALNYTMTPLGDETRRWVFTGGVIVNVVYMTGEGAAAHAEEVGLAADNGVAWTKGFKEGNLSGGVTSGGEGDGKTQVELFLSGNVVIRTMSVDQANRRVVQQVFRAAEVYYDVNRNRAIALDADLELRASTFPDSMHLKAPEMWQLGRHEWRGFDADVYASKRPAQPGLKLHSREATLIQQDTIKRNVFGVPYRNIRTGEIDYGTERVVYTRDTTLQVFDTPVFWLPRTRTDLGDPLGPLDGVGFGRDRVFGVQAYTTWDVYQLLALRGPPGDKWQLFLDYLSDRGPGFGTTYTYYGQDLFGLAGRDPVTGKATRPEFNLPYTGFVRLYGIFDRSQEDILGGDRLEPLTHPDFRGRAQWRHNMDVYENGTTFVRLLTQAEYFTDQNFFEQYYKYEFDMQPNQETFAYLYGATGNLGGSLLVEGNWHRRWVTETEKWPRADGYLIGESLLWDRLVYTARGDIGYYGLRPSELAPLPVEQTDRRVDTARLHLNQKLSAPFDVGPVRVNPYGVVDLAYYSQDLSAINAGITPTLAGAPLSPPGGLPFNAPPGDARGRFYGAGGVEASVTLSRLYPEAASELFNVRGLYHKVTYGANYYVAHSDTPYYLLPQLDQLNDNATDFAYSLARAQQRSTVPGPAGDALTFSPIFDPQRLAIRRLVDNKYDTLDSVQVVQLSADQRLQTKRGFPGAEHVVDWMTLNTSISLYPDPNRDNFGEPWAFLEYYYLWHIGDRTSITSAGWFDPFEFGTRYFNIGINFSRPDGTTAYIGYHHTDPLNSRALTAGIMYNLSRKYSLNFVGTYDFGTNQALSQQVNIARVGTDVTVLFGVSYNALVNNFGVQFALVPNLAQLASNQPGASPFSNLYGGSPFLTRR